MELKLATSWLLSIGILAVCTLARENQVLPFKSDPECVASINESLKVDEKVGQENEINHGRLVKRDYEGRAADRIRKLWQRRQRLRQAQTAQFRRRVQIQQNRREQVNWLLQRNVDNLLTTLQRDNLHHIINRITLRRDILRVLLERLENLPQVTEDRRREEDEVEVQQSQEVTDRSEQTGRSST